MKAVLHHLVRCLLGIGLTLLICAAIGYCTRAHAEGITVGLHLASVHVPAKDGQNNTNAGFYLRSAAGLTAGVYENTLRRTSLYAGKSFALGPVDVVVGIVSGYQRKCTERTEQIGTRLPTTPPGHVTGPPVAVYATQQECSGFARGWLTPMVAPSVALPFALFGATPRLWVIPSVSAASSVLHLSVEHSF
jgi:hypothetical protein